MTIVAVVGANWGDEGKGRIIDALAGTFDYVVRFQGGPNAGHTVINDLGRFVLHQLPSGVLHPHVTNVLGPGVALDLNKLAQELEALRTRGIAQPRLALSNRAGLLLPYQRRIDELEEHRLSTRAFGSTRAGIAPHYGDRYEKRGVQLDDLFDAQHLEERIAFGLESTNPRLEHVYGEARVSAAHVAAELRQHAAWAEPLSCDASRLLHDAWRSGRNILFEGQLGALRDPQLGIYPFVTSSSHLASFALSSTGLPASGLTRVIAVTKAYSSCVGAGPFVTELHGSEADALRTRGGDNGEYGRTTGRPRRVGWFDAVATRYGCGIQGATALALTCLDVLGYLERIPICVAYRCEGAESTEFPTTRRLANAQPVYEWLPGWQCGLAGIEHFSHLPAAAQRYVERVESLVGVPIRTLSVGPERGAMIEH